MRIAYRDCLCITPFNSTVECASSSSVTVATSPAYFGIARVLCSSTQPGAVSAATAREALKTMKMRYGRHMLVNLGYGRTSHGFQCQQTGIAPMHVVEDVFQ